jgi:hypothetical protein
MTDISTREASIDAIAESVDLSVRTANLKLVPTSALKHQESAPARRRGRRFEKESYRVEGSFGSEKYVTKLKEC